MGAAYAPIETLRLRFGNGSMRVEGTIRKFISVPFSVEIREILASGTTRPMDWKEVLRRGYDVAN